MGRLTIKSRSLSTQADYVDATSGLTINVSYNEDATNHTLKSINGNIYNTSDNTHVGNYSGTMQDGEISYSVSGVKSKDMVKVFTAIEDIEEQITGENDVEE